MWRIKARTISPDITSIQPVARSVRFICRPLPRVAGGVNSVTVDPTGQMVFLAGYGGVFVYTINQIAPISVGQLTPVSGSPFGGGAPNFVTVDYTGTFLYAANKSSNDISAYKIGGPSTLTPIPGSPFTAGSGPVSIALVRPHTHPIYSATEIPESGQFGMVIEHQRIGNQ